jgi:hypothetical protein
MKLEIPLLLLMGFTPKYISKTYGYKLAGIYRYNIKIEEMKERNRKLK